MDKAPEQYSEQAIKECSQNISRKLEAFRSEIKKGLHDGQRRIQQYELSRFDDYPPHMSYRAYNYPTFNEQ